MMSAEIRKCRICASLWLSIALLTGCSDRATETSAESVPAYYRVQDPRHEDGSGKYYMGREISKITGHGNAEWLDRPARESSELPSRVVKALALRPADVVADIGAGTGYFTFRLSEQVPHGRVYAVDVQQEMLSLINERVGEEGQRNIVTVLGTEQDPNLPPESVDLALMVDSYHEFSHPREMMLNIVSSLKPGGSVVLVEYRAEDPTVPVQDVHRMSEEQARIEMEAVGLAWRETRDILPQQHFMVFEKPVD